MKYIAMFWGSANALAAASPAFSVPGGEISTLPPGKYTCELPGDAAGPFRVRRPADDFAIVSASSYVASGARGTYLLTGDDVVMTSGPFKGRKFERTSRGFLRYSGPDRQDKSMRCVLATRNNT